MTDQAQVDQFLRCLPGGEWSKVEIVGVDTMMKDNAIHANAHWEHRGGVAARLKCFLPPTESAGDGTRLLVGRERLERIEQRLKRAKEEAGNALVPLLHVGFMTGFDGLLIAMEHVTPLTDLVEQGALTRAEVADLIDQLEVEAGEWMHFDICPGNTARASDGRFVFIDPESYYPIEEQQVRVTYPADKGRLPTELKQELRRQPTEPGGIGWDVAVDVARRKHQGEVLILAAECCLGPLTDFLSEAYVERWLEESSCDDAVCSMLRDPLLALCRGSTFDLRALSQALREGDSSNVRVRPASSARREQSVNDQSVSSKSKVGDVWTQLLDRRRALRAEKLRGSELDEYLQEVLGLARAHDDRRFWREAIVVLLGYQRDPRRAKDVINEALEKFQRDPEFLADQRLVEVCLGVQ